MNDTHFVRNAKRKFLLRERTLFLENVHNPFNEPGRVSMRYL